jgi:hypothetical protein
MLSITEARSYGIYSECGRRNDDGSQPTSQGSSIGRDETWEEETVNHPPHYQGDIECIDAIKAALTHEEFRGFCKGNVFKYLWRERIKGQDESLRKASWYLDRLQNG